MVKCPTELPKLSEKSPGTPSQFEEFDNMPLEMERGYSCQKTDLMNECSRIPSMTKSGSRNLLS